ncbi:hypothetical protein [Rhizobium leguminosarum]|uniref:hypothetical protein n=1 Tax=Rhizobium leguminosarum TaxID=384 RepID=UPI00102FDC40|nr:hypothetical protein [Rhizobium leguminosarum]TBE91376.1 hypothetical protein ELG97_05455 [Rhizobium leguminosarum]TBZ70347.1 hypothetical protein E0H64_08885 [Rhizobium leguminosarum bv. viciae]TBZ87757.1 hypothetical protein E0H61_02650 [Rhizobium leguminosarum bv. viciae]TBZ94921.1 hypothetical protein E0H56_12305 [Rhizobium leguminosarum bv. viciae]UIJ87596.1 hypothetical protein LZK77_06595 [Rhizobium leguminosarum]
MDMEDLNEAGNGSEDFGAFDDKPLNDRPVSIRDSLKAAIDAAEGYGPGDITGQPRDGENGRFLAKGQEQAAAAARAGQPPAANAAQQTPQAQTQMQTREQPASIGSRVPPGWSAEAKAQFGSLPSEVQAAIAKREQEVDNGFRVLQDYKGLEEFTPLIRQAGMTHADVMRRAIDWEKALIHDPVNTVVHVARMAGVNLHALVNGQMGEVLQRNPQQAGPQQGGPQPRSINVEATVEHVLRKRDTETQVDAFLSDPANAHADDVLDDMIALINAGRATSLQDAYDAACWMRPDIRQQLISQTAQAPVREQQAQRAAAADQARRASRSISGSSAPGPTREAARGQPTSIRDSLRDAMRSARGQV